MSFVSFKHLIKGTFKNRKKAIFSKRKLKLLALLHLINDFQKTIVSEGAKILLKYAPKGRVCL